MGLNVELRCLENPRVYIIIEKLQSQYHPRSGDIIIEYKFHNQINPIGMTLL